MTGPQTPEIVQDRGRSPSADSVPSPDQQDHANFAPGMASPPRICNQSSPSMPSFLLSQHLLRRKRDYIKCSHFRELLRIVESCAPDGTTGANLVPNEQLMLTKEQGTVAPASQCAKSRVCFRRTNRMLIV